VYEPDNPFRFFYHYLILDIIRYKDPDTSERFFEIREKRTELLQNLENFYRSNLHTTVNTEREKEERIFKVWDGLEEIIVKEKDVTV
jgi:hypothetical protein